MTSCNEIYEESRGCYPSKAVYLSDYWHYKTMARNRMTDASREFDWCLMKDWRVLSLSLFPCFHRYNTLGPISVVKVRNVSGRLLLCFQIAVKNSSTRWHELWTLRTSSTFSELWRTSLCSFMFTDALSHIAFWLDRQVNFRKPYLVDCQTS
mgnify:FL=1